MGLAEARHLIMRARLSVGWITEEELAADQEPEAEETATDEASVEAVFGDSQTQS